MCKLLIKLLVSLDRKQLSLAIYCVSLPCTTQSVVGQYGYYIAAHTGYTEMEWKKVKNACPVQRAAEMV